MIKVVFRFDVFDQTNRQKAQKLASRISGVKSVTVEGENLLAVVGYFDTGDALKKLRKISNVAIHSVTPAGSRNKSKEGKAKSTEKQKEKIRDPLAEVSDSDVGSPPERLYANELAQEISSRNFLKEYRRKITNFARRRQESKFEQLNLQSKFSGAGGSKALQHKSEVVKSDTTGLHGGVRSHHDAEIECDLEFDRVDTDQGSGLSDTLSGLSLRDEIVKARIDLPSDITRTHLHSQPPQLHGLTKKNSLDRQVEFFTGTKSEFENRAQSIISGAGGSRTLERQYQEVETDINDIPVAPIHASSVSEIEAEDDLGAKSSLDVQSHRRIESPIVPRMQEITDFEEMNTQIAAYLESIKIPPDMPRVLVNHQSPLLINEDDITYLKSVYPRLSYTAKECLSHCALVYLNQEIEAKTLVYSCITDGVVDTPQEVFQALQTLINSKLLLVMENRQSFMLPEVYRYILLDKVIPSESDQYFLMKSGKGLTKPPDVEEWERSKEIHLMDNDLSELPENLNCPELLALFLQRNYNLRVIPSTFFDNMPYLQVLNLSRTRVKTLPDSLFKLVNLRRLFLNRCDLLMMLPSGVGELRSLEVLDLEGTEVINLPNEIRHLTNLTSLKVSFCEPIYNGRSEVADQFRNVLPWRTIMTLPKVKELHIDVSPSDKRWNNESEFFEMLCGLKLRALTLYFPDDDLLKHLKWRSTREEFQPLMCFHITVGHFKPNIPQIPHDTELELVGHHVKPIIPRIPQDAEVELEKYGNFLRYVNGEGFPDNVKRVLEHTTAFVLDHHTNIETLSQFGFENMINLVSCAVGECNKLETIHRGTTGIAHDTGHIVGFPSLEYLCIYYMKSLKSIWEGHLSVGLSCLKCLTIRTCLQLKTIFTVELLSNVFNLEELTVDDCPSMTSIASCDNHRGTSARFLPNLKKISLHYLPELSNLSSDIDILSGVEWMSMYDCPALKSLPINKSVNTNLKEIKGESSWWETLQWDGAEKNFWDGIFVSID